SDAARMSVAAGENPARLPARPLAQIPRAVGARGKSGGSMKIVLAVDESSFSEAAADAVRQWAWPSGSEVRLVSAAEPPRGTSAEVWSAPALYLEEVLKAEREFRQGLVNRMSDRLKGGAYTLKAMVLEGDARGAIVDYAERIGADLVV